MGKPNAMTTAQIEDLGRQYECAFAEWELDEQDLSWVLELIDEM